MSRAVRPRAAMILRGTQPVEPPLEPEPSASVARSAVPAARLPAARARSAAPADRLPAARVRSAAPVDRLPAARVQSAAPVDRLAVSRAQSAARAACPEMQARLAMVAA